MTGPNVTTLFNVVFNCTPLSKPIVLYGLVLPKKMKENVNCSHVTTGHCKQP